MRAGSILQDERECYVTGRTDGLQLHHIYGGVGRRPLSDRHGCWVWLHWEVHRRVHNGDRELDLALKEACQRAFEQTHTREEFRGVFGRSYL